MWRRRNFSSFVSLLALVIWSRIDGRVEGGEEGGGGGGGGEPRRHRSCTLQYCHVSTALVINSALINRQQRPKELVHLFPFHFRSRHTRDRKINQTLDLFFCPLGGRGGTGREGGGMAEIGTYCAYGSRMQQRNSWGHDGGAAAVDCFFFFHLDADRIGADRWR